MNEENIAVRLKFLIENLGINSSQFADNCNISRPTLSLLLSGRNKKISDIIIGQIHKAYPALSIMWLLFNEGDMWVGQPSNSQYTPTDTDGRSPFSRSDETSNEETSLGSYGSSEGKSTFNRLENDYEISEILDNGREEVTEAKENGLKRPSKEAEPPSEKRLSSCLKNPEIFSEIAKFRAKSRKVVQVTIYFDDSTFETFYPGR